MTDAPDEPSDVPPERGARRSRVGDSGSPVASTLSIILAVVAVIAGFLILRALTDDDSSSEGGETITPAETGGSTATTTGGDGSTPASVEGATSTSMSMPETKTGAVIVVANASGISGTAAQMSTALETDGYADVAEPADSTGDALPASIIYFAPNDPVAQAVATTMAAQFGGVQTGEIPAERPAEGADVATATVLVMLGQDAAGKTLAELAGGGAATGTATTVAGGGVAPPAIITTTTGG
ncbi:MAG: LytR C-terminal domain-containing protein [Ilumatobacteraceae bacterium]